MNTGLPGWAVLLIAWGIASVATAAVWSAVKGIDRRLAPIDLDNLTVDYPDTRTYRLADVPDESVPLFPVEDFADAPVDELLTRLERFNVATDLSVEVSTCHCQKCAPR